MSSLDPLIEVLRRDLESALGVFVAAAFVMVIPAALLALFSPVKLNGVLWVSLFKAMGVAWIVATIVSAVVFIFCLGILTFICNALGVHPARSETWGAFFCLPVSLIASCWVELEFRRGWDLTDEVPPRRFTFSLRTLFICQLLLIVPAGLWIGNRRETIISRYRSQAELAEFVTWKNSVENRFCVYGWKPSCLRSPQRLFLYGYRGLNGFTDSVLLTIEPSDQLQLLHLKSDNLTDEGLKTISRIETIEELNLSSIQVTDAGIAHLKALSKLQKLTLDCPGLTEKALDDLQNCRTLEHLHFLQPSISEECAARFRLNRPEVLLIVRNPARRLPKLTP